MDIFFEIRMFAPQVLEVLIYSFASKIFIKFSVIVYRSARIACDLKK